MLSVATYLTDPAHHCGEGGTGARLVAVASVVYEGERYGGEPIYFSDVVVHTDAPAEGFADLAGCRWAFNEPQSQSGVGVVPWILTGTCNCAR